MKPLDKSSIRYPLIADFDSGISFIVIHDRSHKLIITICIIEVGSKVCMQYLEL